MASHTDATPTGAGSDQPAPRNPAAPVPGQVHVIASSGPVPPDRLRRGLAHVRRRFGEPTLAPNLERRAGYFAGDDAERVLILRETAKLWEERGKDLKKAFVAARDAFVLDPDDGESRLELDRLAEATKQWDELARAYERGIERIEGVGQKELLAALARLHDQKRDDPRSAGCS